MRRKIFCGAKCKRYCFLSAGEGRQYNTATTAAMSERHTSAGTKDLTRAVINMNCTNVKTYTGNSMRSGMACTVFLREYLRLSTTIVINDATYSAAIIDRKSVV